MTMAWSPAGWDDLANAALSYMLKCLILAMTLEAPKTIFRT